MKIKEAFAKVVIGFNNSTAPLGERKDIDLLYNIAKANNRKDYLEMFEGDEITDEEKEMRFNEKQSSKINNNNKSS